MAYEVSIEWDNGDVTYLMYRRNRGGVVGTDIKAAATHFTKAALPEITALAEQAVIHADDGKVVVVVKID